MDNQKQPQWTYILCPDEDPNQCYYLVLKDKVSHFAGFSDEAEAKEIVDKFNRLSELERRDKELTEALRNISDELWRRNQILPESKDEWMGHQMKHLFSLLTPQTKDNGNVEHDKD